MLGASMTIFYQMVRLSNILVNLHGPSIILRVVNVERIICQLNSSLLLIQSLNMVCHWNVWKKISRKQNTPREFFNCKAPIITGHNHKMTQMYQSKKYKFNLVWLLL